MNIVTVHNIMIKHINSSFIIGLLCLLWFAVPATAGETLAGGSWVNKGYDIHGQWAVVTRDGGRYLVFDDDFRTRSGPDLKVFLSPRSLAAVTGKTVVPGSVELGPLKSFRGAQEYEIPVHVNLDDYRSLLIHCKAYSHLWGGGALVP